MSGSHRQHVLPLMLLAWLLFLVFCPASVCPQGPEAPAPVPSPGNISDWESQKNEIEDLIARYNGCTWNKTTGYSYRDVYITLKNGTLTLYEYLKDEYYCYVTSRVCFNQQELWRVSVKGYDTVLTDGHGNKVFRIIINRDGKMVTIYDVDSSSGKEYVSETFVRSFCPDISGGKKDHPVNGLP